MRGVPPLYRLREVFRSVCPRGLRKLQSALGSQSVKGAELALAARNGDMNGVEFWLRHGADPNFAGGWPLNRAIKYGHAKIVECLIKNGVNLTRYGEMAMYEAERWNQVSVVAVLHRAGIKKDAAARASERWNRTGKIYPDP